MAHWVLGPLRLTVVESAGLVPLLQDDTLGIAVLVFFPVRASRKEWPAYTVLWDWEQSKGACQTGRPTQSRWREQMRRVWQMCGEFDICGGRLVMS